MSRAAAAIAVVGLLTGCGAAAPETPRGGGDTPATARACSASSTSSLRPVAGVRQSSTIALAHDGPRLVALLADTDSRAIHVVDVASGAVRSVEVEGAPEQLLVSPDGRLLVTIADGHRADVFEAQGSAEGGLVKRCEVALPAGPFAAALSEDGGSIAITSAWDPALTVLDAASLSPRRVVALPRSPRGVLVTSDRVFVSHLAGSRLSVVDLGGGEARTVSLRHRGASAEGPRDALGVAREAGQGYALASVTIPSRSGEGGRSLSSALLAAPARRGARIVVPSVSVDPGDEVSGVSMYYGPPPLAGIPKQSPVALAIDAASEKRLSTHTLSVGREPRVRDCMLPRAILVDDTRQDRGFIACMGIDEVQVVDATALDPMAAVVERIETPAGPTGLALSPDGLTLFVHAEIDGVLRVVELGDAGAEPAAGRGPARDITLPSRVTDGARRGRALFYAGGDAVSFDGLACASCHPDGGDDGLSWTTPEGLRQTPMLAGRLVGTAPYGWDRGSHDLRAYITQTVSRLRGSGLDDRDLGALVSHLESLPLPPRREASPLAGAGREVFLSEGCATCHTDVDGTDREKHLVDEGSNAMDTPSLRHVAVTGPFFHDGRYRTLDALLEHSDMGRSRALRAEQRASLVAFLESL
ncbi:MAG: hypothetical protein JNL21_11545 [Myxococcales bacterium]|nr:hypothetical protein [Myxococcales bacterium]